ncbi:MAG TPA: hypothetical protein HA230_03025 [Candidatus Aenigmarchaeota archaeon]|nr:hypothetical protein [Candidatus Aenigmarchaeota archaeon]
MIKMQLPIKAIVVMVILVIVLVALSSFLLQSSGGSISGVEAERIFNTKCLAYGKLNCDWKVTYEPDFPDYVKACRILYGQWREAFSCLYTLCNQCYETADLKCSGLCNICKGHENAGVDRQTCCLRYQTECSGSAVDCSKACPTQ